MTVRNFEYGQYRVMSLLQKFPFFDFDYTYLYLIKTFQMTLSSQKPILAAALKFKFQKFLQLSKNGLISL